MVNIPITVFFYGGQWKHYNFYENYKVTEILVDDMIKFDSLVDLILQEIQLDGLLELSVILDLGKDNIQTVFTIKQDKDICSI